jgi:hypothetical protein
MILHCAAPGETSGLVVLTNRCANNERPTRRHRTHTRALDAGRHPNKNQKKKL